MELVLQLFLTIDSTIYLIIAWLYNLIMDTTNLQILTEGQIARFTRNMYAILGIVMVFFVSYRIIYFIISPDVSAEKGRGLGALTSRIFVSIILIISIPWIFQFGFRLQEAILSDDIIGRIIHQGGNDSNITIGRQVNERDWQLVYRHTNSNERPRPERTTGGERFSKIVWSNFWIVPENDYFDQAQFQNFIMDDRQALLDIPSLRPSIAESIRDGIWNHPLNPLNRIVTTGADVYPTFLIIVSTVGGVFCLILMALLFFDIVMRLIRLTFLQLLAPIFVGFYVVEDDPKTFRNWVKITGSVYLLLFIRLFMIHMVMWIIGAIGTNLFAGNMVSTAATTDAVRHINILIIFTTMIFALLYFAWKAPEWFGKLFPGMEGSGSDAIGALKAGFKAAKTTVGIGVGVAAAVATGGAAAVGGIGMVQNATGAGAKVAAAARGLGRTGAVTSAAFKGRNDGLFGAMGSGIEAGEKYDTRKSVFMREYKKDAAGNYLDKDGNVVKRKEAEVLKKSQVDAIKEKLTADGAEKTRVKEAEKATRTKKLEAEQANVDSLIVHGMSNPNSLGYGRSQPQLQNILRNNEISDLVKAIQKGEGRVEALANAAKSDKNHSLHNVLNDARVAELKKLKGAKEIEILMSADLNTIHTEVTDKFEKTFRTEEYNSKHATSPDDYAKAQKKMKEAQTKMEQWGAGKP